MASVLVPTQVGGKVVAIDTAVWIFEAQSQVCVRGPYRGWVKHQRAIDMLCPGDVFSCLPLLLSCLTYLVRHSHVFDCPHQSNTASLPSMHAASVERVL